MDSGLQDKFREAGFDVDEAEKALREQFRPSFHSTSTKVKEPPKPKVGLEYIDHERNFRSQFRDVSKAPAPQSAWEKFDLGFEKMPKPPSIPPPQEHKTATVNFSETDLDATPKAEDPIQLVRARAQRAHSDPAYRQKLLGQINKQGPDTAPREWLNPITSFEKWKDRYVHNVWDPMKEALDDHSSFGPVHKVMAAVATPFNAISSLATTTLGYEKAPSFLEAAEQDIAKGHYAQSDLGAALTFAGAFALDMLNPLNFLTLGGGEAWTAGKTIARRVPAAAGVHDLEKVAELGMQRYRQAPKMTPQNIRDLVAPQMTLENAKGAFSGVMRNEAKALGAPIDAVSSKNKEFAQVLDLMEGKYKYNEKIPGLNKTYTELVADARKQKDLHNYQYISDAIAKPGAKIEDVASVLANNQAWAEKAVWDARPMVRMLGRPVGWGEWRIPSPFEKFRDAASSLVGKWTEFQMPKTPVVESLGAKADEFKKYIQTRLGIKDEAWKYFHGKHLEDAISSFQVGILQSEKGLRDVTGFKGLPGVLFTEPSLEKWVYSEINPKSILNPVNRELHLDYMISAYEGLRELIAREPKALWSRTKDEMDIALETLNKIKDEGADAFIARYEKKPFKSRYKTVYDPRGKEGGKVASVRVPVKEARPPEQIIKDINDNVARLQSVMQDVDQAVKPLAGVAAKTPGSYVESAAAALSAAKSDFGAVAGKSSEVWVLMDNIRTDWELLMSSNRPYAWDIVNLETKRNVSHLIDAMRLDMNAVKLWTDKYFVNSQQAVTGVEALGRMLNTPGGRNFWKEWATPTKDAFAGMWDLRSSLYTTDATGAVKAAYALEDDAAVAVKSSLAKKLASLEKSGKMSATEVNQVGEFVGKLSNDQLGKLLYTMSNVADSRLAANLRARVMHQLAAPFESALEKAEAAIRSTYASDLRQIYNEYGHIQTNFAHKPNIFLEALYRKDGPMDLVDRLYGKVMRSVGFSPLADSLLRRSEAERVHNTVRAEAYADKWSAENIVKNAEKIDPNIFANAENKKAIEFTLNEAYGKIAGHKLSLDYSNPIIEKYIGKPAKSITDDWQTFVRKRAERETKSAYEDLIKIFGDKTKAEAFVESVDHQKFLNKLFEEESRLGMQELPLEYYLNYKLLGNNNDVVQLQRGIDALMDKVYGLKEAKPSVASPFFGPSMPRQFLDIGEVMAKLEWENALLMEQGKIPMDVHPVHHISALIGERYKTHLEGVRNRRLMTDLQSALPDYVRVFTKKPGTLSNYKDVGDIISSFKGRGWYVNDKLFDYLKMYVPVYNREKGLWDVVAGVHQYYTRLSTNFGLYHLKNQMALAAIAEVKPSLFQKWIKYMWDNRDLSERFGKFSPIERMKFAIDEHPLYQEMIESGVTHFRGDADFKSVAENVMESASPQYQGRLAKYFGYRGPGYRGQGPFKMSSPQGPFTTFIFDVVDRALKLAKYEELRMAGIPATSAADMVNHYLIDYSCRMLNPAVKRGGYVFMPFFAWNVGNGMLHIPNMLMNPKMYSVIRTAEHFVNSQYSPFAHLPPDKTPSAVAYAIATPWTDSHGYTQWLFPELPHDSWERLLRNIGKNPMNFRNDMAQIYRFIMGRSRISGILFDSMNYTAMRRLEDESILKTILGSATRPGEVENMLWGLGPYKNILETSVRSMVDPKAWGDLPYNFAMNMFMRTEPVNRVGRPAYEGDWKEILARKMGYQ